MHVWNHTFLTWIFVCSELRRISFIYNAAPFQLGGQKSLGYQWKASVKNNPKGRAMVSVTVWLQCTVVHSYKIINFFPGAVLWEVGYCCCLQMSNVWDWTCLGENVTMLMSQICTHCWHPPWWVVSWAGRLSQPSPTSYKLWSKYFIEYLSFHFWHFCPDRFPSY